MPSKLQSQINKIIIMYNNEYISGENYEHVWITQGYNVSYKKKKKKKTQKLCMYFRYGYI